ncbi:MAG: RNB domain-containing ribonuclease [Planctomycetes bacterium]|nr:RNB domain-containing ribonuclease [Planctomycetota bacterium]
MSKDHSKDAEYEQAIRAFISSPEYRPMRSRDISYALGYTKKEFPAFRGVLEVLRQNDEVQRGRDSRWRLPRKETELVGDIDIAMAGHGFVIPENREDPDVFVPPDKLLDAFDGDTVRVKVSESERNGERRLSGRVVEVIKRARTRIVAKMIPRHRALVEDPRNQYEFALEYSPEAPARSASQAAKSQRRRRNAERAGLDATKASVRLTVSDDSELPPPGQKVLIEVLAWPLSQGGARAVIVEVLGPSGDPDTETAAILAENGAPGPFPEEVVHEARRLERDLTPAELAGRLDCTGDLTCTIDPVDARDFDDALGLRVDADGNYIVDVHIADVAHYVTPKSILDEEARDRSTSIYLPERVIPMLPEEISNDICSLRPLEVRPAKTVRLKYTPEGDRVGYTIHRSVIRSSHRFAYEEVRDLITHPALADAFPDQDLMAMVRKLYDLAMTLRKRRLSGGAVELNLPEFRVVIDAEGKAVDMVKVEHDFSHQLVEEFMLAANRAVAEWAASNGLPALHRQHPAPKEERVLELAEYLNASGYPFKPPLTRKKLNKVIEKAAGKPEEHAINLMILKSFQQAVYGPDADIGHFALNFTKYMHFTSPIRRYPDLYLHQMLDRAFAEGAEKANKLPKKLRKLVQADENLETLGHHTSGRERRAMRIEEEVKDFRRLELLSHAVGQEFEGVVTGIKRFGIFVEISGYYVESLIHKTVLAKKGFSTREELPPPAAGTKKKPAKRERLAGDPGFHIGQVIRVKVRKVDLAARQCDLDFLGVE